MIKLITNIPKINNDIADIIRLFYSFEKITYEKKDNADIELYHTHIEDDGKWKEKVNFVEGLINKEFVFEYNPNDISTDIKYIRHLKRSAMLAVYNVIKSVNAKALPWGALTGVRPTQFYRSMNIETEGKAHEIFANNYGVSGKKLELVEKIISSQKGIYKVDCEKSVDLYIGIPFCPTRCEYCSFISFDMSKHKAPLNEYTQALLKEIEWFNSWRKINEKALRSVYIGGGTPTSIGAVLLQKIISNIDIEKGTELTVEAGRPDTIDYDMLKMLDANDVTRISINPQSMNDDTLKRMKRPHTSADIKNTFEIARKFDFIINMDLILGLEGETTEMLEHTLNEVAKMYIDNLTIHTLAIKRASKLKENMDGYNFTDVETINRMVELSHKRAYEMGMHPYYMYRQKYMSGNLENVGFAKESKNCVYNIDIMEETHNLIALGAGAISKRMYYDINKHVRFANHKSISHYIDNIDAQLLKKDDFFAYN